MNEVTQLILALATLIGSITTLIKAVDHKSP